MNNQNILTPTYANQQQQMGWVQIMMDVVMPLSMKMMSYGLTPLNKIAVMPLSKPQGGNLDVIESVASQTPEDFIAHPEMHPLRQIRKEPLSMKILLYAVTPLSKTTVTLLSKPWGRSLYVKASVPSQLLEDFTAHPEMHPLRHIHHGARCIILIIHHPKEPKLGQLPFGSIKMNLQDNPQNTEGNWMQIRKSINRFIISKMWKYAALHWRGLSFWIWITLRKML